jgi:hypothetical protein
VDEFDGSASGRGLDLGQSGGQGIRSLVAGSEQYLLASRKLCQLITHDAKSLDDAHDPARMHDTFLIP